MEQNVVEKTVKTEIELIFAIRYISKESTHKGVN